MKKLLLLGFLSACSYTVFARFVFEISGEIKNPQRSYIVFTYNDSYLPSYQSDTINLTADNTFNISRSSNLSLVSANIEVTPEQNLRVYCVANQKLKIIVLDSLRCLFEGNLKRMNDYALDDQAHFKSLYERYRKNHPDFDKIADDRSDLYFSIKDSMTLDRISFLEDYFKQKKIFEEEFVYQEKQGLIYSDLKFKLSYNNPVIEKFAYYRERFKVSDSRSPYMFSDKITFDDTTLLVNSQYLRFTRFFFMELVDRFRKANAVRLSKEQYYEKLYSFVNQLSRNRVCNAIIKASFINDEIQIWMSSDELSNADQVYGRFVDSLQQCDCIPLQATAVKNNLSSRIAELMPLKPGAESPDCLLRDRDGNIFPLHSLKGKLIYIDVWASWCGQCLSAMPSWNLLVEKYEGNNQVAFVSISTDKESDKSKWLKLLEKHQIKGRKLISIGGQESEFAKKFYINKYPTHILLGKDGTIISIDAPGPDAIDIDKYLQ